MDGQTHEYQVVDDPAVARRLYRAAAKYYWKNWVWFVLNSAIRAAFVSMVVIGTYNWVANLTAEMAVALKAVIVGATTGAVWDLCNAIHESESWDAGSRGEVWHCEMTDESWSYRRKDGTRTSHPWSTLRLLVTHPVGYWVDSTNGNILVYRKPLIDAGLDDEFRARLQG